MIEVLAMVGTVMGLVPLAAKDRAKVKALRQDLIFEIHQNRQMIADFLKSHKQVRFSSEHTSQLRHLLGSLPTASFERIRSSEISIDRYFPEKLVKPNVPDQPDKKGTRQYLIWMHRDKSMPDLLRRYYGRIVILKHRIGDDLGWIDIRYLAFILRVINSSLKK